MEHVHKDLIIAWANGAKIEVYSDICEKWIEIDSPKWDTGNQYRIKTNKPEWIKVDGVRPKGLDDPFIEWYSVDGRMDQCYMSSLNFGMSQKDPKRVMFIRILKDE